MQVRPSEAGSELLDLIARRLGISRNKAKAQLDSRRVFVNGRRVWMARHKLRANDEVRLATELAPGAEGFPARAGVRQFDPALILFQDDDYIIVNKPPGINTNGPNSLEGLLRQHLGAGGSSGNTPIAVHRLDRDTSGCVIFARNRKAREVIIPMFAGHAIRKTYHAIVLGKIEETQLALTRPLNGQTAVTLARVLSSNKQASHLLIRLETGRTHQIRKHFSGIRHPVAGDASYNRNRPASETEQTIPRQMLHAFRLEFKHPATSVPIKCEAPLPRDFLKCMKRYGLT